MKKYNVIDLFAGCGGLSYGFMKAGFDVVLGIDNWKDSLDTFSKNHPGAKTHLADLAKVRPVEITKKYGITPGQIDVIIGGPPCQGFSISGKRKVEDPRNGLYKSFVEFVGHFKPNAFVLENVPNLTAMGGGLIKDKIINDFEKIGYKVVYKILRASDYGVPQNRRRVIFVGLKNGNTFTYPEPTFGINNIPFNTSYDALSDLPEHSVIDGSIYQTKPLSEYQKNIRINSTGIYNHEDTKHSEQTVKIISLVPDGGNYKNLPPEYQNKRNVHIAWTRINSIKPSITIDTGHRHHFHYKFNRVPTVRESARLQSFPDTFIFSGSKTSQYKQVGNAVPPILAEAIGVQLLKYL